MEAEYERLVKSQTKIQDRLEEIEVNNQNQEEERDQVPDLRADPLLQEARTQDPAVLVKGQEPPGGLVNSTESTHLLDDQQFRIQEINK